VARFGWDRVDPSLILSLMTELARSDEVAQDEAGLVRAEPAKLGSLVSGDLFVRLDVLQDHLLLLEPG
jgi:hypothetical protein